MKSSIKKAIAGLSAAAMLVSAMQVVSAWYNDPETVSDFEYKVSGGEVYIEKYIGASKSEIVIPNEIDGYPVTTIKDYAFSNVVNDVEIYVPDSVDDIRDEAFITAGTLNKVVIEYPAKAMDKKDPTLNDIATFWANNIPGVGSAANIKDEVVNKALEIANGKIAEVKDKINNQLNSTINDVVKDLTFEIPEVNLDDYNVNLDLSKELDIQVDDVEVNVELKGADYATDANGDFIKLNKTTLENEIKKQIGDQIESEMAKIRGQIEDKKTDAEKKIEDAKKTVGDAQDKLKELEDIELPDVDKMVNDIKDKINKSVDDMIGDIIDPIMTSVDNYTATAIVKAQDIMKDIPIKGSISETAVEVLKDVRGFGDGTYRSVIKNNYDKAANKVELIPNGNIIDKMNEYLDKAIEKYPYSGLAIVAESEDNEAYKFAEARGIEVEVGEPEEPTEPTKETVTSIVTGEPTTTIISGETVVVPGSTSIVYVDNPKETVTSIVTVEVTKIVQETVIVEKTVPVYITEAKPKYESGDVNMNGKIDLYDAIWIAEFMVKKRTFTDEQIEIGDMPNTPSGVELYDAIAVATILVKQSMGK